MIEKQRRQPVEASHLAMGSAFRFLREKASAPPTELPVGGVAI
jgi:hypothetical protein